MKTLLLLLVVLFCSIGLAANETKIKINDADLKLIKDFANNQPKLMLYGTEYRVGDNATVFLQLLEGNAPRNNASCWLTTYLPNKSKLSENVMVSIGENGLFYLDFSSISETGVYMESAACFFNVTAGALNATSEIIGLGTSISGTFNSTWLDDSVYRHIDTVAAGTQDIANISYLFPPINLSKNITEIRVKWNGKIDNNNQWVYVYLFNYNTSQRFLLASMNLTQNVESTIYAGIRENTSQFIANNGTIRVSLVFVKNTTGRMKTFTDFLNVEFIEFAGEITETRGSGEMHVSPALVLAQGWKASDFAVPVIIGVVILALFIILWGRDYYE